MDEATLKKLVQIGKRIETLVGDGYWTSVSLSREGIPVLEAIEAEKNTNLYDDGTAIDSWETRIGRIQFRAQDRERPMTDDEKRQHAEETERQAESKRREEERQASIDRLAAEPDPDIEAA